MSQKIPKIRVVSETDRSFTNDKSSLIADYTCHSSMNS
jgi:hypothetical protein